MTKRRFINAQIIDPSQGLDAMGYLDVTGTESPQFAAVASDATAHQTPTV